MKLKWIPIDPENLPQGEVLARDDNHQVAIGVLSKDESILCSSIDGDYDIQHCTHYAALDLPTSDEAFAAACVFAGQKEESLEARMAYLKGFIHGLSWLKSKID